MPGLTALIVLAVATGRAAAAQPAPRQQAVEMRRRAFGLPLNNPGLTFAAHATHMRDTDWVVGVRLGHLARAYPWWLLQQYHVANDTLGDSPVFVALCEICTSAAAYSALVPGHVLDFRHCGYRAASYAVCDAQTSTRWQPFIGRAYAGPLKATALERLPVYIERWGVWKKLNPHTTVIAGTSEQRDMRMHSHFVEAGRPSGRTPLDVDLPVDDRRLPKDEMVFGLIPAAGGRARAYPLEKLRRAGGLREDVFDGRPVLLLLRGELRVHAYLRSGAGGALSFRRVSESPFRLRDQHGSLWNEWGEALEGPSEARQLEAADGFLAKWYVWSNAFPDTEVAGR